MALSLTNIQYNGKDLGLEIIRETFDTSLLHTDFGIRVVDTIKSKYFWWDSNLSLVINDGSPLCPTYDTNFSLQQNFSELCPYHVSSCIANDQLIGSAREINYDAGVLNERVSQDTQLFSTLIAMVSDGIQEQIDTKFLNDDAIYNCQDGLLFQFENPLLYNPVPAGQLLNPTNDPTDPTFVQAQLSYVINNLPGKYRYGSRQDTMSKPKFAVSYAILSAYLESLTHTAPSTYSGALGINPMTGSYTYRGYDLVPIAGLADQSMFLTSPDNIVAVYDSSADATNIKFIDEMETKLCKQVCFRIDWRSSILFGKGDKIVYYRA
jgi:hypothetical protein